MSRRIEVLILIVLAVACGFAFWHISEQTIVPVVKYGSGSPDSVQVTTSGWMSLLMSALGVGGFSIASVVTLLKNFGEVIPTSNPFKKWVAPVVDAGQIAIYRQAYSGAKSQAEKDTIRAAAKLADDSLFDELFPVDGAAKQ